MYNHQLSYLGRQDFHSIALVCLSEGCRPSKAAAVVISEEKSERPRKFGMLRTASWVLGSVDVSANCGLCT